MSISMLKRRKSLININLTKYSKDEWELFELIRLGDYEWWEYPVSLR